MGHDRPGVISAALRVVPLAAALMIVSAPVWAGRHDGRAFQGGGRGYYGGARVYGGGPSFHAGMRYYGGGRRYWGGHYHGGGYGGGYGGGITYIQPYRCYYPHTYIRFGFGFGYPSYYYYRPAYRYYYDDPVYVAPRTEYVEPDRSNVDPNETIDVTNEPPPGCYYYDSFCDRRFSNLDEYTDHLHSRHHSQTIEIVEKDSGDTIRTLEFV